MYDIYCKEMYKDDPIMAMRYSISKNFSTFSRDVCKREGDTYAEKLKLSSLQIEGIQDEAKAAAEREKERFYEEVYERRLWGFEDEIVEHMKWAAIISIFLTIVGRYSIKFFKWVSENMDAAK
jgi:hypothetical protein